MCFSAEASFVAGTVLSIAGIASVNITQKKSQIVFAAIPLLFGIQQLTEGVLWLALQNEDWSHWKVPSAYVFLFFAQVVWPTWVPLSLLLLEKQSKQKKILYIFLAIGLIVSAYLFYRLATTTVLAEIVGSHIFYDLGIPAGMIVFLSPLYFVATVLTPFFTSIKKMWALGFLIFISYVITKIFFENYVISVWCFFGALISVVVYAIIFEIKKNSHEVKTSAFPNEQLLQN